VYSDEPAAIWFSGGRSHLRQTAGEPVIIAQVAVQLSRAYSPPGWVGFPAVWDPGLADNFQFLALPLAFQRVSPVYCGYLWHGTPGAHCRFDCTRYVDAANLPAAVDADPPQSASGAPLVGGRTGTFDIYRPFGAAVPTLAAAPGTIYPDLYGGRGSYSGGNYYTWTDVLDCADTVDIRDGMARAGGLDTQTYSDGDEVRWPTGINVTRYVVIRVTRVGTKTGGVKKRVYLARDTAHWPGP